MIRAGHAWHALIDHGPATKFRAIVRTARAAPLVAALLLIADRVLRRTRAIACSKAQLTAERAESAETA